MSIEERLTRALEEEADQIEVDVVRLLGVTRGRLTTKLDVRRRRTGRSVLAAAAVAVIATGAGGVSLLAGDDDPTRRPARIPVRSPMTSPVRRSTPSTSRATTRTSSWRVSSTSSADLASSPRNTTRPATSSSKPATWRPSGSGTPTDHWAAPRRTARPGTAGNPSPRRCAQAPAAARAVRRPKS